jgi:hypothetical protein
MTDQQQPYESALRAALLADGHTLFASSSDPLPMKLEAAR